jgi:Kef-type K+ transport system membrane component KefB
MLTSLDEHELLVFWTQLFALLLLARGLGYLCRAVGLPTVIGELGAGVLLGPSVFGRVWEDGFEWFLPDSDIQSGAIQGVAWLGAAFLLVVTGFETDLGLISRLGRAAAWVTGSSLLLPLVAGLAVGFSLPAVFRGELDDQTTLALFIAAALSVSSLAVVGKILSELGLMRRDFGQITVAAGMANDVVGWVLLGVFAGIAASGEISVTDVALTILGLAVFVVFAFTIGQRLVDYLLRRTRRGGVNVGGGITVTMIVALGFGVITQWLGVEALLGMFIAGIVVARSRFQQGQVAEHLESITASVVAPLFFATAGLRADFGLLRGEALVWTVIIVVVAVVAKFVGAYGGARIGGLTNREGMALGSGLNARGALEIVIATVGVSLGVLSDTAFAVIVLVPLVTSLVASVGLRLSVRGWEGTATERERLDREETLARNVVVNSKRMLLPTAGSPNSIVAAQVMQYAWPDEAPATVAPVGDAVEGSELEPIRNVLFDRRFDEKRIKGDDLAEGILAEARLGYGVCALGLGDTGQEGRLLSPVLDEVLSHAPIPMVVVRRARNQGTRLPAAFSRALVPVTGGRSSRAAQEIACSISQSLGTELVFTHVVDRPDSRMGGLGDLLSMRRAGASASAADLDTAERIVQDAIQRAAEYGVSPRTDVRTGSPAGSVMVSAAGDNGVDLVILGASLRHVEGRPFLGHAVEHVLETVDATVVVVLLAADPQPSH